jgi:hypothetical protein
LSSQNTLQGCRETFLGRFDDISNDENYVCLDHCGEGSEYMYRLCPIWFYNLHELVELDDIDSLLENDETDVNISNSHRAHGGCDLSTEDAYSSKTPDPIHVYYLQWSVQAWFLLWIVPFTWSRYWFGLQIFRLLDRTYWFWLWVVPFPWSRHTDFDFWILHLKCGTWWVGPVDRGCLYSLTPNPTSGFSRGPCLLNFLDLYFMQDLLDWSLFVIFNYFFILMGKNDSLVSKTAIYIN